MANCGNICTAKILFISPVSSERVNSWPRLWALHLDAAYDEAITLMQLLEALMLQDDVLHVYPIVGICKAHVHNTCFPSIAVLEHFSPNIPT